MSGNVWKRVQAWVNGSPVLLNHGGEFAWQGFRSGTTYTNWAHYRKAIKKAFDQAIFKEWGM